MADDATSLSKMESIMNMQALILREYNAPLARVELARPQPGPGQVLVRIAASGLNPLDLKIRAGAAAHARHPLPLVLGIDMAGIVEAVGAGVTAFQPGDQVYGMTGGVGGIQGSLAQYAAVDAALLAHKPAALDLREAAALPLSFITAYLGLVDRARVQSGQTVLVQGGAGGVGHVAVQLARALGAQVSATATGDGLNGVAAMGAAPIDYRSETVEQYVASRTGGRGFDVVYDSVGGPTLDASFAAVSHFGHVVSALGWGTHTLAPLSFREASYSGIFTLHPLLTGQHRAHHGEMLREAARLVDAGQLRPHVDPRRFDMDSVEQAYDAIAQGTARAKIVVDIG
jgi:NADPH2:quinone reductase